MRLYRQENVDDDDQRPGTLTTTQATEAGIAQPAIGRFFTSLRHDDNEGAGTKLDTTGMDDDDDDKEPHSEPMMGVKTAMKKDKKKNAGNLPHSGIVLQTTLFIVFFLKKTNQ